MSSAPSPESQAKQVKNALKNSNIEVGQTAYLVSVSWFNKWKQFTHYDKNESVPTIDTMPQISNNTLLYKEAVKPNLTEGYDYVLLHQNVWKLLYSWYKGGPEIPTEIVEHPVTHKAVPIISKWTFTIVYNDKDYSIESHKFQLIKTLKENVCEMLGIDPETTRVVDYWNRRYIKVLDETQYILENHLVNTQELLIELKDTKGNWPRRMGSRGISRTKSSQSVGISVFGQLSSRNNGHVGLKNLGNTCYFNSSVQSLCHIPLIATYFINADWRNQINSTNKLSTAGQIANAFAAISNDIWMKPEPYIIPTKLYQTITKYAPRFDDGMQHDSQELLMFLLDGLHEDLNRANRTEYIEGIEGDGSCDEETSEAAWKRHKMINDSIIVDLFHGQLRSELTCPKCNTHNLVFDPYVSITLPFPSEKTTSTRYYFIPFDLTKHRNVVKVFISNNEVEDIMNDVKEKFQTESVIVMFRDDLSSDFGIKLLPSLRKVEYLVFELPDLNKKYALFSLHGVFSSNKFQSLVDSPLIVESPSVISKLESSIIDRLDYLWNPSQFPTLDCHRLKEKKLGSGDNFGENEKIKINFIGKSKRIICSSFDNFIGNMVKATINPKFMKEAEGFSWGALAPINKEYDTNKPTNRNSITLNDSLDFFSQADKLDEMNEWFCPTCKQFVRAIAKLEIWSVPDNLILHIKRFVDNNGMFTKINDPIDIPEEINMAPYVRGPQRNGELTYKLYSVIHHIGTMAGGHYISTTYSQQHGKWFTFNDDSVYPTPTNKEFSESAYVLFYIRNTNVNT